MNQINNKEAIDVLSLWTALEVLTYQSFRHPKELADDNDESLIFSLKNGLPWQKGGETPPRGKQLFYEIVIGTIDAKEALTSLNKKYGDAFNRELSTSLGEIIMLTVVVNSKGYVVKVNISDHEGNIVKINASSAVSSFAWALPMALREDLKSISEWSAEEKRVKLALSSILIRKDSDMEDISLDIGAINATFDYLVEAFKIPKSMLIDHKFGIKMLRSENKEDTTEENALQPRLLNSFYLNDLRAAQDFIEKEAETSSLHKYLGIKLPVERFNILSNNELLEKKLSPQYIPKSKWPASGRSSLSLLQQAAVNISMDELANEGIIAINGPPGTGKTTLLRDIIASVITQRAKVLMEYDDPAQAFIKTGCTVKAGRGVWQIYKMDKKLKGFEVLIASSNNKAVENVSAELPSIDAIASDATKLRYFNCLSDKLLNIKTWGLVSAVLGNATNRNNFCNKFRWDENVGMATYLLAASKRSRVSVEKEIVDEVTGKITTHIPKIVEENNPPLSDKEAQQNWQQARKDFKIALEQSDEALSKLGNLREMVQEMEEYEKEVTPPYHLDELIYNHSKLKPNFIKQLFGTHSSKVWKYESNKLVRWSYIKEKAAPYIQTLKLHIINRELLEGDKAKLHMTAPWCDAKTNYLRDEVFISAIKLHKAFIDMAATPLRHNLCAFMHGFTTQKYDDKIKSLIPELWSSFFLVVPSISTTFASVEKMLEHVPRKSLGWLLIDEAGQAIPQAAVGALMKAKRAIITGDPMQLEPVVTLPETLVNELCKQFNIDTNRFCPPRASVQTLADITTPYFSELNGLDGSRAIGLPLLIHRRCSDPMFSVANKIAYDRLMVHSKLPKFSAIANCLGLSQWFDVQSKDQGDNQWFGCEGELVIELLQKLMNEDIDPDLYIVSPFKIVANNLQKMIKKSHALRSWGKISEKWIIERVGTIHTTQGREAEAVILVLGAQGADQAGTRGGAGKAPNLLNVALTRAKEAIYVVGHKERWKRVKYFSDLYDRLESQRDKD